MKRFCHLFVGAAAFVLASAPTLGFAQEAGGGSESATDVVPVAVWTLAGVLITTVVGTVFYLLKRRVGGFPANPAWKAPITIMLSKDSADEGTFGETPPVSHDAHH